MLEKYNDLYQKLPYSIRFFVYDSAMSLISMLNKRSVVRFLNESQDEEYNEIALFLKSHRLQMIPYLFTKNYKEKDFPVFEDEKGFLYIDYQGHRLYGKDHWGKREMQRYFSGLVMEQDPISPHCYFPSSDSQRYPAEGSVIADIGAAEGVFGLSVIERAKTLYLFECNPEWIVPLQRTFAPWKDKVHIVPKYVGDQDSGEAVTLDTFFADKQLDYLKADIEGAEESMCQGGEITFSKKLRQALLCAYHKGGTEEYLKGFLSRVGFEYEINPGYMMVLHEFHLKYPYFRRGVFYCRKKAD